MQTLFLSSCTRVRRPVSKKRIMDSVSDLFRNEFSTTVVDLGMIRKILIELIIFVGKNLFNSTLKFRYSRESTLHRISYKSFKRFSSTLSTIVSHYSSQNYI